MRFVIGKPIETEKATVEVDPLPPGSHRFRLVVTDRQGQTSAPFDFIVTVQRRNPPRPP